MKKLHKLLVSTAFIASSFVTAAAHADNGFYLGGSVGNASLSTTPSSGIDVNSDDTGYKVFGGFKFTIVSVEASYVDFGKVENLNQSVSLTGYDLFGLLNLGIGPIDLFGKLGVFSWDADLTSGTSINKDGTDPVYGVGAGITLGSFSVRAEYEYFDVSDLDSVSMISLGAAYIF
ncbi:outer membrane beta-barrel protein [Kaarinaea lacus]